MPRTVRKPIMIRELPSLTTKCVMVHMPARHQGELRKPFDGPYKIVQISSTGVEVQALGCPQAQSWRVAWDWIRPYYASEVTSPQELSCTKASPPTSHSSLDAQFLEPKSQDQIPVGGIPAPPTSLPHDLEVQEKAGDLQP